MATNEVYKPGWQLAVVVSDPVTPTAGDPVRYGVLTGIALLDEGAGGVGATETVVDFGPGVWDIPVTAESGAVAAGDTLFYDDAIDGVNNDATNGYFFGFALEAVASGTVTIKVLHTPSPGTGTLGDGTITAAKLANNALAADGAGRAKMQAAFFGAGVAASAAHFAAAFWTNALVAKFADGLFAADAGSRAKFTDGIWTTAKLAAGVLSADAPGRALVGTGWLDVATALAAFGTDTIANAWLLQAIANGSFQADTATRALFADGIWTEAKLDPASLTGTAAKVVADANIIGGVPVLHRIDVADGTGNTDVVLTHKTRVIDAWALNTGIGAHATNDTWQVKNSANAISDAVAKTATVHAIKRISTIDPTQAAISAGGTLRIAAVKDLNSAVTVYVLGIRVA